MRKVKFSELINIDSLKKMAENIYAAVGINFGIVDIDGTIIIATGWQDICTKFHRVHPVTCMQCSISDQYISDHIMDGAYISYKCLNNMRDIALPIVISGEHLATIFFSQFFYEDEVIDKEYFAAQAIELGFDEKEYLDALSKVPVYSKKKVDHIIEYYSGLIMTLAESGLRQLTYENSQNELEKSQKYLSAIFNSVSDSIFIHDVYGNITDVNGTATTMFGYSRNELISMNVYDIISKKQDNIELYIDALSNKKNGKDHLIQEFIVKNKSNKDFWVEVNVHATKIHEDEVIIATVRDITERKKNELALQNEAAEIEKLRSEFFANISHELRTPLNIILGTIKIIEMGVNDEKNPINREKIINNINIEKHNCFRLLKLINNLIDLTKLDVGFFELNMVNCNIVNIVEEITLSVAEHFNNNGLSLIFDTDIEEKIVDCDLEKIERIMLNMLSNAIKFTTLGGSIFVNIYDGEEYITISIEDTGIGIPDDKVNLIFDRFRQADKSFTRKYEGSGIGLSLVKSLVEIQGGTITVESKHGVGTKFFIKLPVKVSKHDSKEESIKSIDNSINDFEQRIKIEFSDVYK
ncbi:PocR ligand-binding domain-containing protein [Clostridium sp. CF011]|uniref:sensor histidine kinase n=1 Tax=Clostridium sp. CF011 TaxID=2843318 RepID=UPI001C0D5F48|nr:PocR ligand-binding domain-containing protein [Clostridium sp. CF011]MBU3092005.1 PocR ligand-binding domain-containing protein [Clostridium sp. CF011]WAG71291.1 PocR ligand-binding domain-containing protein [Clostridium sp. CF011]